MARLACLRLSDEEAERLAVEVSEVLKHFAALREVAAEAESDRAGAPDDLGPVDDGGPPAAEPPAPGREVAAPLREDEPGADPLRSPPADAAPRWADGFFLVPRPPGVADRP